MASDLDLSTVGLVFPVAAVLGYFVGGWIGSWFDAVRTGQLVGLLLGIASGFYNLLKVVYQLNRREERRLREGTGTTSEDDDDSDQRPSEG